MSSSKQVIKFFGAQNPNGFLSNMYPSPMKINGKEFKTVEHAFQSKKFEETDPKYFETVRKAATPKAAKQLGKSRAHPIRKDWNTARIDVMKEALEAKFSQNEKLQKQLIATGDAELIENNPRDFFWGGPVGKTKTGQNMLGKLLSQVRSDISKKKQSKKECADEELKKAGKKK